MAKKGVVMYYDLLEQLKDFSDEQFGKIARVLIKYDMDGIEPNLDDLQLKLAFQMLKPSIDRNREEYEQTCELRRIAGAIGGRKKAENLANLANASKSSKTYQNLANLANLADNDNDNDIDIDIDNKKKSIKKKSVFIPPTLEEVKKYAESRGRIDLADKFYDYFNAGEWIDSKGNKVKNWKQKFITWEDNNKPVYQQKENIKCSAKQLDNGVWKI